MSQFTDFFWPTLEKLTPAEREEDDTSEAADIAAARMECWTQNAELALEEAHRLADSEEDRRRTTEGKASTYLLFAAAFAAALIPFLPGILEGKTGSAPRWLIAAILIVAALYLMAAGIWAFRTLRVGTYHRLDVAELAQMWQGKNPTRSLIRETFVMARLNYRAVNEKVSCIKLAHEFMARSFVAFGILVVIEAGWEAVHSVTEPHGYGAVVDSTGASKVRERGAVKLAPQALTASKTRSASLSTKSPPDGTASGTIKSGNNSAPQAAANVGTTSPGTSVPVKPTANGRTGSAGGP